MSSSPLLLLCGLLLTISDLSQKQPGRGLGWNCGEKVINLVYSHGAMYVYVIITQHGSATADEYTNAILIIIALHLNHRIRKSTSPLTKGQRAPVSPRVLHGWRYCFSDQRPLVKPGQRLPAAVIFFRARSYLRKPQKHTDALNHSDG